MNESIYSNAFNFGSYITGGVDARTGQYSATIQVVQIRPPNQDGLSRDIRIAFSALNTANRGFGVGWSMSLCSLDVTNGSNRLTLSDGRTFRGNALPPIGQDLSFKDQKLKDFRVKRVDASTFDVIYKDGIVERLVRLGSDPVARLTLLKFPSGETFQFYHQHTVSGVPYLTKIVFLQTNQTYLQIDYQGAAAYRLSYPVDHEKTAQILFRYQNDLLTSVSLPYDASENVGDGTELPRYTMSYVKLLATFQVIERFRSPTGSVEMIQYKAEGHKLNDGRYIPYAIAHTVMPGHGQPDTKKTYTFSQDRNFLGYASGNPEFVEGEDNLYLVRTNYSYQSTENVTDGTTNFSSTSRSFNKFHLLASEIKVQQGTRITTTIAYNEDPSQSFEQQPANLQKPRSVITRYEHLQDSGASRDETVETETDDYGNTLSTIEKTGIKTTYEYFPVAGAGQQCPADPFGFLRYVKRITVTPAAAAAGTAAARSTEYTYVRTSSIGEEPAPYYVNKATETLDSGLSKSFAYNDTPNSAGIHGLLREFRSTLNGKTTVVALEHGVEGGATITTTTTTGFDGAQTVARTRLSRITSRRWQETDMNEVTTAFTYDVMGRLVQQTMSPGTSHEVSRRYEYNYPRGDEERGSPVLVETDAQGVGKKIYYDSLGRVCAEDAQDDDRAIAAGGDYQGTFRRVAEKFYDVLGQLVSEKRYDWWWDAQQTTRIGTPTLGETTYEYDGWGELRRTTFPDGRVELSIHDPVAMTVRTGIEGEGSTLVQLNLFDLPVTETRLRSDNAEYSVARAEYDGFGRKVSERDPLGNTVGYSYDQFDRVTERHLPEGTRLQIHYADFSASALVTGFTMNGARFGSRSYDSLGRVTSESVGGRTSSYSYQVGSGDNPTRITTPRGDVLTMNYAPHLGGKIVALNAPDANIVYRYNPRTSALSQAQSEGSTQELGYFASGLAQDASEQTSLSSGKSGFATSYAYSMSGLVQKFVDGFSNQHKSDYDAHGRLMSCQQGSRKASFDYDRAGRPARIRVEDTAAAVNLTTSLAYDDFGREIRRATAGAPGRPEQVIETSYRIDGRVSRRLTTAGNEVWRDEAFMYDARSRLEEYRCAGSQPPQDTSGRPLRAQRFAFDAWSNITRLEATYDGHEEVTIFSYSAQDPTQLSAIRTNDQTLHLEYDAAGNLTRDEQGRELQYDSQNRLIKVLDSDRRVLSEYRYDAMGKLVAQSLPGRDDAVRCYQGEIVSNQSLGDRQITYLSAEGQFFAQGELQGAASGGRLFATDKAHSLVTSLDVGGGQTEDISYTPYGARSPRGEGESLIGFNGESMDPVTGWYFLGNGYRIYNPTLMRFHSPDNWSPFGQGGVNPYVYCVGDPINRADPTGHLSAGAWTSIGIGVAGILFGIFTLGAGAAISAGAIAATGFIGAVATTSALSVTATVVGIAASAVGIASASLEDNQKASSILGWVSTGLGFLSGAVGLVGIARSAASAASAGATAARSISDEVAGIGESIASRSLMGLSRGEAIATGFSVAGEVFGLASYGVGAGATIAAENGDDGTANILGWVSRGLGIANVAANVSSGAIAKRWSGNTASFDLGEGAPTPTPSRASRSDVALRSARPLSESSSFRVSSDRVNNVYNNLPASAPHGVFRNAALDARDIFITRL